MPSDALLANSIARVAEVVLSHFYEAWAILFSIL